MSYYCNMFSLQVLHTEEARRAHAAALEALEEGEMLVDAPPPPLPSHPPPPQAAPAPAAPLPPPPAALLASRATLPAGTPCEVRFLAWTGGASGACCAAGVRGSAAHGPL